jgi:hypothetical protein
LLPAVVKVIQAVLEQVVLEPQQDSQLLRELP